MRLKSSLLIATAIVLGTASFAFSQTAPYDATEDGYLSYGPKRAAPAPAPRILRAAPVNAYPCWKYDQTEDKYLSAGGSCK